MTSLKSLFNFKKVVYGIEITIQGDGLYKINYSKLLQKKGEVEIIQLSEANREIEKDLLTTFKEHPVVLSVDGKGVLHKIVANSEIVEGNAIHAVLPGANAGDFEIQVIEQEQSAVISIIRKSIMEEILHIFKSEKIHVVGLSIGPFNCLYLEEIIGEKSILSNVRILQVMNGNILSIAENNGKDHVYNIESMAVSGTHIVSVANALSYILNKGVNTIGQDVVLYGKAEEKYKMRFKVSLIAGLAFLITVFSVNYLLNNNYSREYELLQENFISNQTQTQKIDQLETDIALKKELLAAVGTNTSRLLSFYADRLALTVPDGIVLSDFGIFPLLKDLKPDKEVEVRTQVMEVSGNIYDEREFNNWLRDLRALSWVAELRVDQFRFDEKKAITTFNIVIEVK